MKFKNILFSMNLIGAAFLVSSPVYAANTNNWYQNTAMVHLDLDSVPIYTDIDTTSRASGSLNAGDMVTVEASVFADGKDSGMTEWFLVQDKDGNSGYVLGSNLSYEKNVQDELMESNRLVATTSETKEAETTAAEDSSVQLTSDKEYTVVSIDDNSVGLKVNGETVVVDNDDMKFSVKESNEEIRSKLVEYACSFVGNPYRYGGTSLTNGTDCSGFTMRIFENYGIALPHSSSSQRSYGVGISKEELKPGDLVCYSGHVAIYIGDGQIVHAANSATGIVVGDMMYSTPVAYRSLLND